ncbi:hypothetical protein M378DRAFT_157423 [Amanita muscaria Koide BX008]|uniref:BTB domain-containing protein n=1 Tax=Amanita muscaria (strain Koide BX008) TaxID=946122 RepID=A0A0C2TPN8_AMAMK|nr:hypothetical protein M378DRAFT_157423 [Amanita muscaria Koide BX008]
MPANPNSYGFSDDADVILRSSDNVEFYVISALLRYVSLVFKHMFASSESGNDEKKDNLPVVPVAEDSETLCLLLDIIYPYQKKPQLSSPFIAWKVSKAAQKYLMNIIESKLKRHIANSKLIAEKPLSIYAIAIDLGWEGVALDAARRTLTTPLQKLAYVNELQRITGAGFYRFLEYRRRCKNSKNPQDEVLPRPRRHKDLIKFHSVARALEPYTRSELSDLILQTPDGVDFYVVAALLRLSSPFFNRGFPLENPVMRDGLAVIDVEEDSNILFLLLGFIYPAREPGIQSAELYAQLVFAARKYEMTDIENKVKKHAAASSLVTAEPLRVYAVASTLGWRSLAKMAALNTLHTPFQELSYVNEMHLMTGTQLFRLMRFSFVCADAVCDVLKTYRFERVGFGKWLRQYWRGAIWQGSNAKVPDVLYERLKFYPRGSTVSDPGLSKGIAEASGSFDMPAGIFFDILRCMQDTPKVVEKAVSKVPPLCFFQYMFFLSC